MTSRTLVNLTEDKRKIHGRNKRNDVRQNPIKKYIKMKANDC